MIGSLDHIGIAVESLEDGLEKYVRQLGLSHTHTETVETEKVRVAILHSGKTRIELLEATDSTSPISKFLGSKGGGIHHLAFEVESIDDEVQRLRGRGVRLVEPAPRPGAQGSRVAFVHPRATGGVLIELVERKPVP